MSVYTIGYNNKKVGFINTYFPFVDLSSEIALFLNLLIVLILFDTLYTIIGLIGFSLPAEMAITQKARSEIATYGAIFWSLSFVLSFMLPVLLLTADRSTNISPIFLISMIASFELEMI